MRKTAIVTLAGLALLWIGTPASADPIPINLTTWASSSPLAGFSGTGASATAVVEHAGLAPTGSGTIQSFVRLAEGSGLTEQGYNTDFRPLFYDENNSPTFTRDLPLSLVPIVSFGGQAYYEFGLDINQNNDTPGLVLDDIRLYQSNDPSLSGAIDLPNLVWRMDRATNNGVELNFNADAGSGKGDMFLLVPTSVFDTNLTYVYLYSHFGGDNVGTKQDPVQGLALDTLTCLSYDQSGNISGSSHACGPWFNNDGYEEWFVRGPSLPPPVPEPASLLLLGTGLSAFGVFGRRLRRKK